MAHVCVQRLRSGDTEEHAPQDGKGLEPVVSEIGDRVARVEPEQYRGMLRDTPDAQQRNGGDQTAITGPKARPMRAVPQDWMANSAMRIATAVATT